MIGRFIVDFYCHKSNLVIEVDGSVHDNVKEKDEQRALWLQSHGLTIIRFTNEQVLYQIDKVKETIMQVLRKELQE